MKMKEGVVAASQFHRQQIPAKMEINPGGHKNTESDQFYDNLQKLNHSSGLSLVFNFRDTMLDLHCLYKEVIKRGGFYQVANMGNWDDVASASNLKSSVPMSAAQLQNVYEILLLEYELRSCHKTSEEANLWPDNSSLGFFCSGESSNFSTRKRKHCDSSSVISANPTGDQDCPADNYSCEEASEPKARQKNSTTITSASSNVKELITDLDAPLKPRTGYNIFLRLETHRLKMIHDERANSLNLREMALDAWRCLPEKDKQPYLEASKMDKERYEKEIVAYKQLRNHQNAESQSLFSSRTPSKLNLSTPLETDDVYHVSLEAGCETLRSPHARNEELTVDVMKNPKFQMDWNSGGSLDDGWTFF